MLPFLQSLSLSASWDMALHRRHSNTATGAGGRCLSGSIFSVISLIPSGAIELITIRQFPWNNSTAFHWHFWGPIPPRLQDSVTGSKPLTQASGDILPFHIVFFTLTWYWPRVSTLLPLSGSMSLVTLPATLSITTATAAGAEIC